MMFNLSNHVAVVTGGNGGLGLAYCRGLVKSGAKIAIWARNTAKNDAAVEELRAMGAEAEAYVCDVTDEAQIADAFAKTLARFGQIDSCFANAGGTGFRGYSHETDRETWLAAIDLNLMSVVQTWKPVTAHMIEREIPGRLIVSSSIAALGGTGMAASYSTTKAAVRGLVQALAVELGPHGIRVNSIMPGFIETEMSLTTSQAFQDAALRRSAIKRIGELDDMEGVAVFLASRESDFMTGQGVILDGGSSIYPL